MADLELELMLIDSTDDVDTDAISIHTSDRASFRRCRRKWNWSSPLRNHYGPIGQGVGPLWLGSGFHFALEDYHGYNKFGHPTEAFLAYVKAHRSTQLPQDHKELTELGLAMLSYYVDVWLPRRAGMFKTLWVNGAPQVEVKWRLPLFIDENTGRQVDYVGTFDRVVVDTDNRIWVQDYKTAARAESMSFETDAQISAYSWAARILYGDHVEGVIWTQFLKKIARGPEILASGEFSQNRQKVVPWGLYHAALIEKFGEVPQRYVDHLNWRAEEETEMGDSFVRMHYVRRNLNSSIATFDNIVAEVTDMVNPDLALYPNPNRDCGWDCPFRTPCITMDDGYDFQLELNDNYEQRVHYGANDLWRSRIVWPS